MQFFAIEILLLTLTLASSALSLPYRAFSSRSVPGRIRASSEPDSLRDYLSNYLETFKQHQLQNQQYQYNLPEYEPVYQQGYLSRWPEISPETIAALLPYLYQSDANDYTYEDSVAPSNSYSDDDGTWYDDSQPPEFIPNVDTRDKQNQDAALLQLFLDHLTGKYSLEDLETLERQAALEDNTENQLQALMPRKKSSIPLLGSRPMPRKFIRYPERKGQKEEPLVVPASSIRKPIFTRTPSAQRWQGKVQQDKSTPNPLLIKPSARTPKIKNQKSSNQFATKVSSSTTSSVAPSTTMEPSIKSAYEAFMSYLDQERFLRKAADEAKHSPQKRFISEPQSLTQQLASLKKTIT